MGLKWTQRGEWGDKKCMSEKLHCLSCLVCHHSVCFITTYKMAEKLECL